METDKHSITNSDSHSDICASNRKNKSIHANKWTQVNESFLIKNDSDNSNDKLIHLNENCILRLCAAPDCNGLIYRGIHCEIHYKKFQKAREHYKKEQSKIQKYLYNPSLLDKLSSKNLIRIAGISLAVSELRREQSKMGFREDMHDEGHKIMIEQLLSLSMRASEKLTVRFNLPSVTKDIKCSADSRSTMTVDDDGNPSDPLEIAIMLKKERDETIKAELARKTELARKAQAKIEKEKKEKERMLIESDILLTELSERKQEWMDDCRESLITFMGLCNLVMIKKRGNKAHKIYSNPRGVVWITKEEYLEDILKQKLEERCKCGCTSKGKTLRGFCNKTERAKDIPKKCPTDKDFENFYQRDVDVSHLLSKMTMKQAELIIEDIYDDCPKDSFMIVSKTPKTCLKFLIFVEYRGKYHLMGEWIVRLKSCPCCPKLTISIKYLEYVW